MPLNYHKFAEEAKFYNLSALISRHKLWRIYSLITFEPSSFTYSGFTRNSFMMTTK